MLSFNPFVELWKADKELDRVLMPQQLFDLTLVSVLLCLFVLHSYCVVTSHLLVLIITLSKQVCTKTQTWRLIKAVCDTVVVFTELTRSPWITVFRRTIEFAFRARLRVLLVSYVWLNSRVNFMAVPGSFSLPAWKPNRNKSNFCVSTVG